MKLAITIAVFCFSTFVLADSSSCMDLRKTFFKPCDGGESRLHVQGICEKPYEAESTYCAIEGRPECLDMRKVFLAPCKDGKKRILVQGQCTALYEFEHSYCAKR